MFIYHNGSVTFIVFACGGQIQNFNKCVITSHRRKQKDYLFATASPDLDITAFECNSPISVKPEEGEAGQMWGI